MAITNYAKEIELYSLTIPKLEYEFFEEKMNLGTNLLYSFSPVGGQVSLIQKSDEIVIRFPMMFSAINEQDQSNDLEKEDVFFELKVEYKLVFKDKDKNKVSKQVEKDIIEQLVPRIVHPYFRLTISESLQKAGLPPLLIPLIESHEENGGNV